MQNVIMFVCFLLDCFISFRDTGRVLEPVTKGHAHLEVETFQGLSALGLELKTLCPLAKSLQTAGVLCSKTAKTKHL